MERSAITVGVLRPFMALLLALFCSLPASVTAAATIRIGGTGAALGTIRLIADAFEKEHGITVAIPPSMGSSGGIKAAMEGVLDVALSSRPLKEEERKLGLSEFLYATSAFVPIAHSAVPVKDISRADIARILTGSLTNWPNGERIRFVLRPVADIDTDLLRSLSPDIAKALDAARSREGMLIALTDQTNADMIEKTPGAIGFSAFTLVKAEKRSIKVLFLDGVPLEAAQRPGAAGPMKSLYAVTRADAPAGSRAFVQFLRSPQGRKILERSGNIPVQAGPAPR